MREQADKAMAGFANLQFGRGHFCLFDAFSNPLVESVEQCRRALLLIVHVAADFQKVAILAVVISTKQKFCHVFRVLCLKNMAS